MNILYLFSFYLFSFSTTSFIAPKTSSFSSFANEIFSLILSLLRMLSSSSFSMDNNFFHLNSNLHYYHYYNRFKFLIFIILINSISLWDLPKYLLFNVISIVFIALLLALSQCFHCAKYITFSCSFFIICFFVIFFWFIIL